MFRGNDRHLNGYEIMITTKKTTQRLPPWIRAHACAPSAVHDIKKSLRHKGVHTVCEEARCPNLGECFGQKTATYLIMGALCTRRCGFCAVTHGTPSALDPDEPARVAAHAAELGLAHVVITSVTRDDLDDGGAGHFVATIRMLRAHLSGATIEVLTPDFHGDRNAIHRVCDASPDVFNHNLETVERLTPHVRDGASYRRSLDVLACAHAHGSTGRIKSGLMLGFGETRDEVVHTLEDLRRAGCAIVTIGQYLRPSRHALPVVEYVPPEVFCAYADIGLSMGFARVMAGPLVRSSYHAAHAMDESSPSPLAGEGRERGSLHFTLSPPPPSRGR